MRATLYLNRQKNSAAEIPVNRLCRINQRLHAVGVEIQRVGVGKVMPEGKIEADVFFEVGRKHIRFQGFFNQRFMP